MGAAAEWATTSLYAPDPREDVRTIGTLSVSNLSWSQQQQTMSHAPALGGRRQWCGYSFELTGYGSVELCGPLAYRVTIVHPDDAAALRQLHRIVRSGRLRPAWYQPRPDVSHIHVLDRAELCRTRADARGSWLFAAQAVARLCGTDDEVAQLAGPALRRLLWAGRRGLVPELTATITELLRVTESFAEERQRYLAAIEQRAAEDLAAIRLETQVLAAARREWG